MTAATSCRSVMPGELPHNVGMAFAIVVLLFVVAPVSVSADAATDVDAAARSIFGDFMSPYCPGLMLADCGSTAAMTLRSEIRAELQAGRSEAEVRAAIESKYGDRVRAAPLASGFGLVAWVTPAVFVLLGAAVVFAWSRRRRQRRAPVEAGPVAVGDTALQARLERELRGFDEG